MTTFSYIKETFPLIYILRAVVIVW